MPNTILIFWKPNERLSQIYKRTRHQLSGKAQEPEESLNFDSVQ